MFSLYGTKIWIICSKVWIAGLPVVASCVLLYSKYCAPRKKLSKCVMNTDVLYLYYCLHSKWPTTIFIMSCTEKIRLYFGRPLSPGFMSSDSAFFGSFIHPCTIIINIYWLYTCNPQLSFPFLYHTECVCVHACKHNLNSKNSHF